MSFLCQKLQANFIYGRVSCDLPIQIKRRGSDNACTLSWSINTSERYKRYPKEDLQADDHNDHSVHSE